MLEISNTKGENYEVDVKKNKEILLCLKMQFMLSVYMDVFLRYKHLLLLFLI
jgi:hypothetical protein